MVFNFVNHSVIVRLTTWACSCFYGPALGLWRGDGRTVPPNGGYGAQFGFSWLNLMYYAFLETCGLRYKYRCVLVTIACFRLTIYTLLKWYHATPLTDWNSKIPRKYSFGKTAIDHSFLVRIEISQCPLVRLVKFYIFFLKHSSKFCLEVGWKSLRKSAIFNPFFCLGGFRWLFFYLKIFLLHLWYHITQCHIKMKDSRKSCFDKTNKQTYKLMSNCCNSWTAAKPNHPIPLTSDLVLHFVYISCFLVSEFLQSVISAVKVSHEWGGWTRD
jgi:hypothetical protein